MHVFSFEPETEVDRPEIAMGRKGMHDWGGAGGSAAFLFDAATKLQGWRKVVHFLAA